MGQQILVVGLGTFGGMVAAELAALGHEVMGCDRDPRLVAEHADRLTQAFELDATDAGAIAAVGPRTSTRSSSRSIRRPRSSRR